MRTNGMMLAAVAAMVFAGPVCAVEADEKPAAPAAAEAPKRKPVKKDPEYMSWEKALAVSTANEQPIVAFIELKGDKACSKVRMATVGNPAFKEFVKDNCVFYRTGVPQKASRQRAQKDELPKPDFDAVKASEAKGITLIKGTNQAPNFPMIAVLAPGGTKMLGTVVMTADDVSFSSFVKELQSAFERGKIETVISKKVQKALDDEAKKRAALEKRAGK